jgi:RecA-family ATPase
MGGICMKDIRVDFLLKLFELQCGKNQYFILSAKKGKQWQDCPHKWVDKNKAKRDLTRFFSNYPQEEYDLYFSTVVYNSNKRRKAEAVASKFLWQDIDEQEDINKLLNSKHKPSIIWESSPNKYQGLWEFDRYLPVEEMDRINPQIGKEFGCDDCYDVGHVLRIPGTVNHKYKNEPKVGKPKYLKKIYRPKEWKAKSTKTKTNTNGNTFRTMDWEEIAKISSKIPQSVKDKYYPASEKAPDRSGFWFSKYDELFNGLFNTPDELFAFMMMAPNPKYDTQQKLCNELNRQVDKGQKFKAKKVVMAGEGRRELKLESFDEVMSSQDLSYGWLVEGFWGRRSHGIVAGQPKVFKSTFVQDLSVSVASGKPFLGTYKVHDPGPVIIVQNENTPSMLKDRNEKMMNHKGLVGKVIRHKKHLRITWPQSLPIYYMNQQGFTFDDEDQRNRLEVLIEEVKPVLVIFDPLYLMFTGDINSAKDLQGVLMWLLDLKNKYNTAIMLVHHYNKGVNDSRGGQRMLGSVTLHGWVESAWYMRRDLEKEKERTALGANTKIEEPSYIILEREFRKAGSYPEVELSIKLGDYGSLDYEVSAEIYTEEDKGKGINKEALVRDLLYTKLKTSAGPMTRGMWLECLSDEERMGVSQKKLKPMMDSLVSDGYVINRGNLGYMINDKVEYKYI